MVIQSSSRPAVQPLAQSEQIFFPRADARLRAQIAAGDMPFLGLYADVIGASWRKPVRDWLAGQRSRLDGMLKLLQKWPALGAAYLMAHVVEHYGGEQGYAVYPALASALGVPEAGIGHDGQRRQLWEAFRFACLRLGLDVLDRCEGTGYMVAEYRHQAGLSLACAERLGSEMATYARLAGLPDDDDPAGIRLWRDGLLERTALLASVREALRHDAGDYYVRAFLRALREPEAADAPGIVRALASGYAAEHPAGTATTHRALAIPQVCWRDGVLAVELPATAAGDVQGWRIERAGESRDYPADTQTRSVVLLGDDGALPAEVQVTALPHGLQRGIPLWADGRGNRLLVFGAGGVLVAAGRLGGEEQWLAPGEYTVVSRFCPQGREDEASELDGDCTLYEWPLQLAPGERVELRHGPAVLALRAWARPRLSWTGHLHRDLHGSELYAQPELALLVELPPRPDGAAGETCTLTLSLRGARTALAEITLQPDAAGRAREPLEAWLDTVPAGPVSLLAELRRKGQNRVLARQTATVWIGLDGIEAGALICRRPPHNRAEEHDDNLEVRPLPGGGCRLAAADAGQRSFRIAYRSADARVRALVWPVAGVFVDLLDYGVTPVRERPLASGELLAVRRDSRAVLDVRTGGAGELRIGPHRYAVATGGRRRLPVALLAEALDADADTLTFVPAGSPARQTVLQLVLQHRTLAFTAGSPRGSKACGFRLAAPLQQLRLTALNLVSGRSQTLTLIPDDPVDCGAGPAWLGSEPLTEGGWQYTLTLAPERWQTGAWVLTLAGELDGRPGWLLDAHGERCSVGLLVRSTGERTALAETLAVPAGWLDSHGFGLLARVQETLQTCPRAIHRPDLDWLPRLWRQLARQCEPTDAQSLTGLLALSLRAPAGNDRDDDATDVPHFTLGSVLPTLYTRPAVEYAGFGDGAFAALAATGRPPAEVFGQHLSPLAAAGFVNFATVVQGACPREFAFGRYARALAGAGDRRAFRPDWQPHGADCLGPQHLPWARAALRARLTATQASADADARPGHALRLARCLQHQPAGGWLPGLSSALLDFRPVLGTPAAVPDEQAGTEDTLDVLAHALALYAGTCRLEARVPGTLARGTRQLACCLPDTAPDQRQAALGWLLAAGRELFAFYLLLWELALSTDLADGVPAWSAATAPQH